MDRPRAGARDGLSRELDHRSRECDNGNFRDGILESFAASKTYPGHLYVTYEDWRGAQMDVRLSESIDGGTTWRDRGAVADAANAATTDQFQPQVATGPGGGMAVAFYDRRSPCPNDASVRPSNIGAANTCIDVSAQAYRETGASTSASPVGANVRLTQFAWDPAQPAQTVGGIGQIACSGHDDPCSEVFIGDYVGLALSQRNLYGLFVSTHYPSSVPADGGGRVFYQQQVLATASRKTLGIAP